MPNDDALLEYNGSLRLVRRVAVGGMATVYEAEQLGPAGFSKSIALKVIHSDYAREPEFLQLFIDEAKLSANLMHGNVVQIYQLGELGGEYFIAMEFIRGPTLRSVIDRHRELREPIPRTLASYVTSRVCRALDFAHNFVAPDGRRLDIVHRDVSPGNIMASWDGHIKLADFGIAKASTSIDPAATRPMLMGKKRYMSPEQMLGLAVEAPSDVFSIGVVFYELLTLQSLFREELTELAIDEVAVNPLPSIRALLPDIDPELEQIIGLALERNPDRRPTAAAMGKALDAWCSSQNEVGSPDRLQEHLQRLFPSSYQAPSVAESERTSGTSARRELNRVARRGRRGRLTRALRGWIGTLLGGGVRE